MELINWRPLNELDNFFSDGLMSSFLMSRSDLAVDVYEKDHSVIVKMILPGLKESEISVSIEDNLLTISGERKEEDEVNERNYYSKEIKRGSFSRTVQLPKSVNSTEAEAHYKEGVLKIAVPIKAGEGDSTIKVPIIKD